MQHRSTLDDHVLRAPPYRGPSIFVPYERKDHPSDALTSVVILSLERQPDLERCVQTLYQTTNHPFEVVILDNGSGRKNADGDPVTNPAEIEQNETLRYLHSIDGATKPDSNGRIRVVFNPRNDGCSIGRNRAVRHVDPRAEYVVTMDNDMEFTPGWLDALVATLDDDPALAAANSRIVYANGKTQFNGIRYHIKDGYFGSVEYLDEGKEAWDPTIHPRAYTDLISGGATIIRKSVADRVEHHEAYPNGFEDWDYSMQVRALGWRLANCPDSVVIHRPIWLDEKKGEQGAYKANRYDVTRKFNSLLAYLERTGINHMHEMNILDWVGADGRKPFITQAGYVDIFPDRTLRQLSTTQIQQLFDSILRERKERGLSAGTLIDMDNALTTTGYAPRDEQATNQIRYAPAIADEVNRQEQLFQQAFSQYNLANVARMIIKVATDPIIDQETRGTAIRQYVQNHGHARDQRATERLAAHFCWFTERLTGDR